MTVSDPRNPSAVRVRLAGILLAWDECIANETIIPQSYIDHWTANLRARDPNATHSGDCTKEPHTCMRCIYEEYLKKADALIAAGVGFSTLAPASDAADAAYARDVKLQEIADGAYGDGPRARGIARDALSPPTQPVGDADDVTSADFAQWEGRLPDVMEDVAEVFANLAQPRPEAQLTDAAQNGGEPVAWRQVDPKIIAGLHDEIDRWGWDDDQLCGNVKELIEYAVAASYQAGQRDATPPRPADTVSTDYARAIEALENIKTGRGECSVCGRLADMPSNYVSCDDDRRCNWSRPHPAKLAARALASVPKNEASE